MTAHPGLILVAAAVLLGLTRSHRSRQVVLVSAATLALAAALRLPHDGVAWTHQVAGVTLELMRVDPLSRLFALVFALITAIGVLFALHVRRASEHAAVLAYAGGALGVALAGDWITAFLFWEVMGGASLAVIWHGESDRAGPAGLRYLFLHALGASLFFAGLVVHMSAGGAIALDAWAGTWQAGWTPAAALILAGVAVNAAIPPFHPWLTDAYPEASVTGTVFLSAFTTKTAVYLLIRAFPGSDLLLWSGVVMTLYGVTYAVLENDIRRLLSYHIVSQVGYMVAGVGMGTPLALNGAAVHAFCHILYKALLMMGAGSVLWATGRRTLSGLGGLGPRMRWVALLYMAGAFSISGVPLFNGFVSKSVLISAAADGGWPAAELLLSMASVGTFLSVGLKLPYFTFLGAARRLPTAALPVNMIAAMAALAGLCLLSGVAPGWLYARLPFQPFEYHPYTADHLTATLQLLTGTGVAFWFLRDRLAPAPGLTLDTDWFYRRPLGRALDRAVAAGRAVNEKIRTLAPRIVGALALRLRIQHPEAQIHADRYRAPVGATMFWVLVAFALLAVWAQ